MAGKAKGNKRVFAYKGRRDVSGVFLITDRSNDLIASSTDKEAIDRRTIGEVRELNINALPEEPTDELSVLLAEKIDGAINPNEDLFMPKNPLPDPQLVALVESMRSLYEQNEQAWSSDGIDSPIFTCSQLDNTSSPQPSSTRIRPWIEIASFVAAALLIAFVGAGGWYAFRNAAHTFTTESPPSASQDSRKNVNANTPIPIRQTHKSMVNDEPTNPVSISQTTKQNIVIYKTKKSLSKLERERDSVSGSESIFRAHKPTRSAIAVTTHDDVAKKPIETATLPHEPFELDRTAARSDWTKEGIFKPIAAENATSPQIFESAETSHEENAVISRSVPEMLTREQVRDGFASVYQQISQCAAGKHGVAIISATLTGSGRVVFALVEGDFKGAPEGSCMARAVRKASFPEFTRSKLTVKFPYVL